MISVEEALEALFREIPLLTEETLGFPEANLRFSAKAVHAPYEHPLFDQSAVDGYAFAWDESVTTWELAGQVPAGKALSGTLSKGQCVRIFTGGMMPQGADTVVMQEHTQREGSLMQHSDVKLRKGANVRLRGEQMAAGSLVLEKGERIGPEAVGLLRSVGVAEIAVSRMPRVAVVITGNEFAETAASNPGHIFSSNGEMLVAALQQEGLTCTMVYAPDEDDALEKSLRNALETSDLVITTGGVSVGDHDLVPPTLVRIGARTIFHKVAQKPGKPMLLSRWNNTLILALPGNPRAVMVLFWVYVLPAIRAMQGARSPMLRSELLPLSHAVVLKDGRGEFRAARITNGQVALLQDQGSHMLASLLGANALAYLPEGRGAFGLGEAIQAYHLPT